MVPPTEASPGTVSDDHDSFNDDWKQDEMAIDADHSNADNSARDSFKSSADSFYAGSDGGGGGGGSPAFLRGRGRGRPKLIGDELDADLVDFMVRVKQEDPRRHISATRALERARDYIREKAPGLLEEDGGVIKLRLTWAMKLMARVAERERELFPSLHPASMPMLFPKRDVYNDLTDTVENVVASQVVLAANGQLMH
uniref:Uncharacterized protein n=1 Tax=Plectus sambesii TaxID=2011161 RepID=A0A914WMU0_9BILA